MFFKECVRYDRSRSCLEDLLNFRLELVITELLFTIMNHFSQNEPLDIPKLRRVKHRSHYRKKRRTVCGIKSTALPARQLEAVPEGNDMSHQIQI